MLIDSEDIKQAISQRLLELFPDIAVYKEAKTNIVFPHFFLYQINVSDQEQGKNYHLLSYSMEIRYRTTSDPSTDLKLQQNLDSMSLKLLQGFNIIDFENKKIKCTEKSTEKVEGVLHFFCTINMLVKLISDEISIKQNKLKLEVKADGYKVH